MSVNPEHSSVDIQLSRFDRIYRPNETVSGTIIVTAKDGWSYKGNALNVKAVGEAKLQLSGNSEQIIPPRVLLNEKVNVDTPGPKMEMGVNRFPFSFTLKGAGNKILLETYHGVYITVTYKLFVGVERGGVMKRPLEKDVEFIVEVPMRKAALETPDPLPFRITPGSLENVRSTAKSSIPKFDIHGQLHRQSCLINLPFTGEVIIGDSEAQINSIELQLVRVESVSKALGGSDVSASAGKSEMTRECTEVESLQIGVGDVSRNVAIPIYLIFPRVYTTPTLSTAQFKVEFEVNLTVVFADGYQVVENFPITLHRTQ